MRLILAGLAALALVGCGTNWTRTVPGNAPDGKPMLCRIEARSMDEPGIKIKGCVYGILP